MRYLFGFYFNFRVCKMISWLNRLLCICYASFLFITIYNWDLFPRTLSKLWDVVEYFIFFLISFFGKDKFVEKYYEFNPVTDDLPTSKSLFSKFENVFNGFVVIISCIKLLTVIPFCILAQPVCDNNIQGLVAYFIIDAAIFVAKVLPILVFGLLYYRVKGIRTFLEINGFDISPKRRLTPAKYMQMYINVFDSWTEIDSSIKFVTLLMFLGSTPKTLLHLYSLLANMKEYGLDLRGLGWFMIFNLSRILCLIIPVMYVDLVMDEIQAIKVFLLDKRFYCKYERLRAEIQEFLDYVNNQPLQFRICFIMPMNLQWIIMATSFCISTLMAILQINYNLSTPKGDVSIEINHTYSVP
ncbi:hypothetical protein K1T71_011256 [Dendrolimus kikuchii]|uniref:Uncharacterized protein n=1 Tax=Dendrolimus kikuchii TaxID=765133 RepID=A0ACC1CNK0_9NEOP|nr:hypothetical protein K1T71_011256 [Dendrolimus kikuchii]